MFFFLDEPTVTLANKCAGELMINKERVCFSSWDMNYAHRVCQELDCGNAVPLPESLITSKSRGYPYYVSCDAHHYKLGQCKRVTGSCDKSVSVYCTGEYVCILLAIFSWFLHLILILNIRHNRHKRLSVISWNFKKDAPVWSHSQPWMPILNHT